MTRRGVMTVGYQGFGNLGDEAILTGIEQLLAGGPLEVRSVACGPHEVPAFPNAERIRMRRLLPPISALRTLRRRRALIFSGGGLLHDHWPIVIPSYLAWTLFARLAGARVAWAGVGIGPLRHWWSRWLTGLTLRLSTVVTVRDASSAALVERLAPGRQVRVVPDPAIFNAPPAQAGDRDGIGLVVRGPAPSDVGRHQALVEALGLLAARLADKGEVALMTLAGPADDPFAAAVADATVLAGGRRPRIEQLVTEPAIALRRLAELQGLVSVRLHGVILGALAETPTVGIAYDPKVAAWCERLGAPAIPLDQVDAGRLSELLEEASAAASRGRVAERVAALRAEGDALRRVLESALA